VGNAYDLDLAGWSALLASWGEPPYRAGQIYAGLWSRSQNYEQMTNVPRSLRDRLAEEIPARVEVLTERDADRGATRKGLLRLGERHVIETVVMGYRGRVTVCVSSQSGCGMGCTFCATGFMGLAANLTAGEIASQVVWANRAARSLPAWTPQRVTNVVFMGMGEPMANYRATRKAVARMMDPAGLGLGARHLVVFTVGLVPGIRRLGADHPQVGLAVSLHAADDDLRSRLVPLNGRWPLAEVESAVLDWRDRTGRRPSIEWTLMRGVNDTHDQATLLVPIARRLRAHVNLIPMNPVSDAPFQPSEPDRIASFVRILRAGSVPVTVRDTRGRDIDAACGQLASRNPSGDSSAERTAQLRVPSRYRRARPA
jgi:23S rRNA (adenine2503-C2)-methyltransferase